MADLLGNYTKRLTVTVEGKYRRQAGFPGNVEADFRRLQAIPAEFAKAWMTANGDVQKTMQAKMPTWKRLADRQVAPFVKAAAKYEAAWTAAIDGVERRMAAANLSFAGAGTSIATGARAQAAGAARSVVIPRGASGVGRTASAAERSLLSRVGVKGVSMGPLSMLTGGILGDTPAGYIGAAALGGAYGAYKLSNYYGQFQGITQQTAANTNMSSAALRAYRAMLPQFRTQYPGQMSQVNDAFFRAMNLGFRTRSGMPNQRTYQFVREVMQSALPSGANPGDVANMLGGSVNAYRNNAGVPKGASPDWFMNTIHAGGAAANMNVEQMAHYFAPISSLAAASGSKNSLRQSLAMVGALTQMGFTPQRATTNVAAIWQKLENPPSKARNDLAKLYYSSGGKVNLWGDFTQQGLKQKGAFGIISDLRQALNSGAITRQELLTLFPGTRGGQGMLSLISGNGDRRVAANYRMTSPAESGGQTGRQFKSWMNTRAGQSAEANALMGQLGLYLGQGANTGITKLTDEFNRAVISIGHFVKGNQNLITGLGHTVGSITAFAVHMNPMYLAFKAANGAIGVTNTLLRHGFVAALQDAGGRIKSAILDPMHDALNIIRPWGGKLVGLIGTGITNAIPGLKSGPLHDLIGSIKTAWGGLGSWVHAHNPFAGIKVPSWVPGFGGSSSKPKLGVATSKSALISAAYPSMAGFGTAPGNSFYPNSKEFGFTATSYQNGLNYSPLVNYEDNAGLKYAGGGPAVADYDLGTAYGTPVKLPGTSAQKYTLVKQYSGAAYGWLQSWRIDNGPYAGGVFNFVHLSRVLVKQGARGHGSMIVGYSGKPLSSSNGAGNHLAVIADATSSAFLKGQGLPKSSASGGKGAIGGGTPIPPPQKVKTYAGLNPTTVPANVLRWAPQIKKVSSMTGVPSSVIASYMYGESSGNPNAVSPAGARGLMQLMPGTAAGLTSQVRAMGVDPNSKQGNILMGALLIEAGEKKYGKNWAAIYRNVYNPGVASNDPGYKNILYGLSHFGGSFTGQGVVASTHKRTPYGNALYAERRSLTNMAAPWHGINVSKLPATGGFYSQANYLKYEYGRNQLERQIADNTAKQYAIAHKMSPQWLKHILLQDKAALNAENRAARKSMEQRRKQSSGAAGNVVPVHIIGRCKAEAENGKSHKKTAHHAERIDHHTSVLPHILFVLKQIHGKIHSNAMGMHEHGAELQSSGVRFAPMPGF